MTGHPELIRRLEALIPAERLHWHDAVEPFARDESDVGRFAPWAAVEATSAEEVEAIVGLCAELRCPVVPRGAGTGKAGGALAHRGGVVLSLARMSRIVELDPVDLVAVVQPGVITGVLQREAETIGLFYPPDPNSLESCTLGGNVAHNAGGPRALKYGVTRDYLLATEVVLASGERLRTGHRSIKGVAGYDLTGLLCGSEGTLGVLTELTLQLLPKPPCVQTALAHFTGGEGEEHALAAVNALFAAGLLPRACEFIDTRAMQALAGRAPVDFPPDVTAALVVEVDGNEDGCGRDLVTIDTVCRAHGAADLLLAQDDQQRGRIWETRRRISPSLRAVRPLKVSEDIAVPRRQLLPMVREVRRIGAELGLETAAYGHAGDGNLHVNLLFESRDDAARVEQGLEAVLRAAVALGGTITGEHGVGLAKQRFLPLEQSTPLIEAQRAIKRALDPYDLLNPGKIFP